MKVYTYSEARQNLARLLDEARAEGAVRIRRRDGSEFVLQAVGPVRSGLDVDGVDTGIGREELLEALRESRARGGE